ncbi:PREDICTED: activin receptor type-2A-like, partial [Apaloderma vittatum]|uniref:activin receptor type-2A-like n=1 Tax=Apaloderma vittatum TaxID=57397 RepID=UPI0005219185
MVEKGVKKRQILSPEAAVYLRIMLVWEVRMDVRALALKGACAETCRLCVPAAEHCRIPLALGLSSIHIVFLLEKTVASPSNSYEGAILGRSETQECIYYNANWEKDKTNRSGIEPCYGDKDKRRHCFATWKNISGSIEIVKQGCWLDDINCYDRNDCIEKKDSPEVFFCCCEGNMCNERFFYFPEMEVTQPTSNPVTPKPPLFNTLLYSLVPIMGIAVIVLFSFWMYRHHKLAYPPVLVPTQYRHSQECPAGPETRVRTAAVELSSEVLRPMQGPVLAP